MLALYCALNEGRKLSWKKKISATKATDKPAGGAVTVTVSAYFAPVCQKRSLPYHTTTFLITGTQPW